MLGQYGEWLQTPAHQRIASLRHCHHGHPMGIQMHPLDANNCIMFDNLRHARCTNICNSPYKYIYIYGNGLIWTWIDENCMYPPWDARLALQISANAIFLLCMESCLLAQLHSSPMQSKAMEHSLPQRVRGRDCHCNESDIGIDIELEIIQDISTD